MIRVGANKNRAHVLVAVRNGIEDVQVAGLVEPVTVRLLNGKGDAVGSGATILGKGIPVQVQNIGAVDAHILPQRPEYLGSRLPVLKRDGSRNVFGQDGSRRLHVAQCRALLGVQVLFNEHETRTHQRDQSGGRQQHRELCLDGPQLRRMAASALAPHRILVGNRWRWVVGFQHETPKPFARFATRRPAHRMHV